MLWTRFKRTQENPSHLFSNGSANLEALITIAETLIEYKIRDTYILLEGVVMVHNHAQATLDIDSALNRIVHGGEVIYQCPIGRNFLVAVRNAVSFSAPKDLDIVVRVNNAGTILFDIDSVSTMNSHIIRNGVNLQALNPDITTLFVLEY